MCSTARPQHCGWGPRPYSEARPISARSTDACEPSSVLPKPSPPMAHRLARLVYRMLKYGKQYIDKGAEYCEQRNRQQQIEFVRKKAAQLGPADNSSPCLKLPTKKFLESRHMGSDRD